MTPNTTKNRLEMYAQTKLMFFSRSKLFLLKSLILIYLSIPFVSFAEAPKMIFEENKNQWPEQVKYQATIKGGDLFLEKNTFTYVFKKGSDLHHHDAGADTSKIKFHAFKVNFQNSNPDVEISGNNLFSWHRNYYLGNDPKKWAENVKLYGQVNYKELYPHIDMQVYNAEENLKYDFIVHPGGDPKNIKLNYSGPQEMHLEYGHLYIKTNAGLIIEQKPYAYQVIEGLKKEIPCSYRLRSNTVTFSMDGNYDSNLPLIIDPTLIASSYTGSLSDNRAYTATYDAAGNIYTGGTVASSGYPTTVGAWDLSFNSGLWDIVLTKFNPTGTAILFSTYYGGASDEQPHSLIVNSSNELFVAGRTNSTAFPTLNTYGTSFQTTLGGGYDIIVGKFNSTGGLLASTYVGGNADDCVNYSIGNTSWGPIKYSWGDDGRSEIIIDASSNVYVAANTKSTNFPTMPSGNAFQNALSGAQDAVIFKMNSSLTTLSFSTYLGGTGYEAGYGLKLDGVNNIYLTGGTTSSNFPIPNASVINPTFGGVADGFIAVFNPSLSGSAQLLRSTYLGTAAYDQSYCLEIDASGDLYVYGQTQGTYPVTPSGVYFNVNGGMFIHKVTGNLLTTVFSTVIGSGGYAVNLSPTAFLVDSCQSIYLAGWGRCVSWTGGPLWGYPNSSSTTGMPVTSNAFQSTTDGCDFYFMVLEPDAKALSYATFYGEVGGVPDHVDGGTSRFDKRAVIYESVCASCFFTQGFPTTPGAHSTTNKALNGAQCNNAVIKMDIAVKPVAVANVVGSTTGCSPFTVGFNNTGSSATNFIWDFGDGGTSTAPSPTYTYNFAGTYSITLYAIDSIGICGYIDTSIVAVTVGEKPTLSTTSTNILCNGGVGSATVTPTGGVTPLTYAWSPAGGTTGIASALTAGNYSIVVTDSTGCATTQSVSITQPTVLTLSTTSTGTPCGFANGTATATAGGGMPGYTYSWQPSGGSTSTATGLGTGTYSITVTDMNGCTIIQTVAISIINGATVTATASSPILCNGGNDGAATASLTGGTGPYTYQWSPGTQTTQTATGLTVGTYVIIITDAMGCSSQSSVTIPEPTALAPTISNTPVLCFGESTGTATASVTGGTGSYTYSWGTSPMQITQTATGLATGTYTLLVTDANGCTSMASTFISQPANGLTATAATSGSSCGSSANGGAAASVTNGTAPYTYLWLPGGETTPTISNISGGTYTVIVTDANGCTSVGITTLATSVQPVADFGSIPTISCEGIFMQFTDSSSNALTWNWDFAGLGSDIVQNPGYVFPYNGTYNVTLIVTNPPCADTISKSIVVGDVSMYGTMGEANIFTPNNDNENDCFLPSLGAGQDTLKACLYLEVFDRWGIKMFESVGTNNCWNGNNKQDSKPALDGTYYYIAKLGDSSIRGYVTLARHK